MKADSSFSALVVLTLSRLNVLACGNMPLFQ